MTHLTITLGDALDLVLLFDRVRVGGAARGVDEFLGQAFGHGLEVAERRFPGAGRQQVQRVVDAPERAHVDRLSSDDAGATDTGRVLARSTIDDGVDDDLDRVLIRQQMNDLERVLYNADRHEFLPGVAAFPHETQCKTFHDRTRRFPEPFHLVPARRMWQVRRMITLTCDVILYY